MSFFSKLISMTGFTLLLVACAVGPDYKRPLVSTPVSFKEAKGKSVMSPAPAKGWKVAEPQDYAGRGKWWQIFNDRKLNKLEEQLNTSNQTVLNAYYNYQQARAIADEARASFFPTLVSSLTLTRQKQANQASFISSSSNGAISTGTATTAASGSQINTNHTWLLDASWEPDIWGLVRRTVEANEAGAEASGALYSATRLSSQASLAQFYFELRGLDRLQQLLDTTVTDYQHALSLTQHRYVSGVAARSDVVQAQSQLEIAQAAAVNNGIARATYEHAIAVLIGIPPAQLSLAYHPLQLIPPSIPLVIPSTLLERRPDIAQAERLMAQANAQIGVAVAAYYPNLTLTATGSTGGRGYGPLLAIPSFGWALGTQAAQTLFDGGLRSATVRASEAAYSASVASYRQIVLAAFQDVEDNLASLRILNRQAVIESKAVASARLALKLVMNQYKSGTVPYSSVITAQISAFNAEQTAVNVNYSRMISAVGLVKALGGGWSSDDLVKLAHEPVKNCRLN